VPNNDKVTSQALQNSR